MTQWTQAHEALFKEVVRHVMSGSPADVNFSLPKHGVASSVLNRAVYEESLSGRSLRVAFLDGSRVAAGFPVGCLARSPAPETCPEPMLRLGLMSFRHPELDYLVDLYVTRNRELAEQASMADEEQLTFERTLKLLSDSALERGGEIWAYHTGLEPMVVGFYRGVVATLCERAAKHQPRTLVIRPFLYQGPRSTGLLDQNAPGAKHDSYRQAEVWS